MEYLKLDKKAIGSWRVARVIALGVVLIAVVGMIVGSIMLDFSCLANMIIFGIDGVIILVMLLTIIIYPPIEYRQWKYKVTEDRVEIVHGIIFVKRTVIPIIRIQNITVSQGPVNRKMGLYNIEISIASGSFNIPCLNKETSDEISDNLKNRIYTRLESKGVN